MWHNLYRSRNNKTNGGHDKMATARILDFGKNKGRILADCEEKYLKWLVSHEKVLALRNRWAARDARFILERRAVVATSGNANWNEWNEALQVIAKPASNDLGLRGNLNTGHAFQLMR
jgi:hypothetical protein